MDDSKAILNLSACFPNKPETYLRKMYKKYNCDMEATIKAIHNDKSRNSGGFSRFCENLVSRFQRIFRGAEPERRRFDNQSPLPSSSRQEEIFFEVNIGEDFAKKLEEKFSDPSLTLPKAFKPVIEIPVALGRQIYAAYVESIFRQQEAHDQIVNQLVKEDEEFARKLQEEYDDSSDATTSKAFLEPQNEEPVNSVLPKKTLQGFVPEMRIDERSDSDTVDATGFPYTATYYREQAQEHLRKRQQSYQKAQQYLKLKNKKMANYYFKQAKEKRNLYEQANGFAAAAFLVENKERNPSKHTIDLHHLFVKEAIQALDIFLDDEINSLQNEPLESKSLMIITGRGKHSPHGIPKIKPAVMERLGERSLRYSELNPGLLKVRILRTSYLTHEIY